MVDLNIELPESFFLEEERDGYLVGTRAKEFWAVELDLINEFDRVCKKHNLKYMLDFGTLLGAIRHKGFIPWDLDMDVSMLREDFEKLEEIGPQEFKYPYFFQNQYTEKKYDHAITRLRRSDTTSLNASDILYRRKCNQGIFIDIDVFDNVPTNNLSEVSAIHTKCKSIAHAIQALSEPPSFKGYGTKFSFFMLLRFLYFRMKYGSVKSAWKLLKDTSSQFDYSDYVCCLFSDMGTWIRRRECYENLIRVPFENLMLPVPESYDDVLRACYGDYMMPVVDERMTVLYIDASKSYSELINQEGFYENLIKELNINFDNWRMSDMDFLRMMMNKLKQLYTR